MVQKFTGTGFNANALLLDFLRDQQGNPLKTPNSFLVLHNPVRKKINEVIDWINQLITGGSIHNHSNKTLLDNLTSLNGVLYYNNNPVGIGFNGIDGGNISDNYSGAFIAIDGGNIADQYNENTFIIDGGTIS